LKLEGRQLRQGEGGVSRRRLNSRTYYRLSWQMMEIVNLEPLKIGSLGMQPP